ncbi:CCA tRNA nucleotidyltransferase, mitochondrial [Coemansia sp. RSA 2320]|nr:CCA tRNA nucleotidyltransferase, mitochondrial [Coemansia sp. RSA 2320]
MTSSGSSSLANKGRALAETIQLTDTEREICELLVGVVEDIHQGKQASQPKLELRIAGGWVRDKLLGLESHDIDIAIDHMSGYELAQHVNRYLSERGQAVSSIAKISQNPERSKHLETATTSVLGQLVDFVNLRSEIYNANSRIPEIAFGTAEEDAQRRDITINALFYNIHTRQVEDYTGRGMEDLRQGVVRTPLEPFKTFSDDPLRVLRVVRFASRFEYLIDEETAAAIMRPEIRRDLDAKISRERVGVELEKMAGGPHPLLSIQLILRFGLYESIFRTPPRDQWMCSEQAAAEARDTAAAEAATRCVLRVLGDGGSGPGALMRSLPAPWQGAAAMQRALMLGAYLYPYRNVQANDKKKTVALAHLVIRDGVKLSHADVETTLELHRFATEIASMADACVGGRADRRALGLQIRSIGARWPQCVVFAAAAEELCAGATSSALAEKYGAYVRRVVDDGLADAYAMKHVVDGTAAARILGLRPGPAIRGVLDRVMEWQLEHPQGTREECEAYLREGM